MTDIKEMIENYLDGIQTEYIIDYYNNTIGGDTILTRDDFDSHFDGESYLYDDLIDRLKEELENSDDRSDMPDGFEELFDEYVKLAMTATAIATVRSTPTKC